MDGNGQGTSFSFGSTADGEKVRDRESEFAHWTLMKRKIGTHFGLEEEERSGQKIVHALSSWAERMDGETALGGGFLEAPGQGFLMPSKELVQKTFTFPYTGGSPPRDSTQTKIAFPPTNIGLLAQGTHTQIICNANALHGALCVCKEVDSGPLPVSARLAKKRVTYMGERYARGRRRGNNNNNNNGIKKVTKLQSL